MRLRLHFGASTTPIQMDWSNDLMSFPKTVWHDGKSWEWSMYQGTGGIFGVTVSYDFYFSELKPHHPAYNMLHIPLRDIIGKTDNDTGCDCGADKHADSGGHWGFCKTRKK